MSNDSGDAWVTPESIAPFLGDFYERVARRLGVGTSLVLRVALGEHKSKRIEEGIEQELRAIVGRIREEPAA